MSSDQSTLITFGVIAAIAAGAWGWFSDKSRQFKEDAFNRDLRTKLEEEGRRIERKNAEVERQLEQERAHATKVLDARAAYVSAMRASLDSGILNGRNWLAKFVAEADRAFDESICAHLRYKMRPALKAADEVAAARAERRQYKERAQFLEYQLMSLREYFPFLEDYEDVLLDESIPLIANGSNVAALEDSDPVLRFVAKADYERMSSSQRNQLALDRYLNAGLSPAAIGRLYERYVGHLFEQDGWSVEYHGIIKGLEDLGRDLICSRGNEIKIVQAKCWSKEKLIHEKHIFQLFGTTQLYVMDREQTDLFTPNVTARFVTSTNLSPVARKAADWLRLEVDECRPLSKAFPMIKCNVNQQTKERIYHLPFDQQYDRTRVLPELGECVVATAADAEALGFRRAFRFSGSVQ